MQFHRLVCLCQIFYLLVFADSAFGQQEGAWQMQTTGVDASLRGLCVVDANVVWSSGTEGTVVRTINGGNTWQNVSLRDAEKLDFRDVHAFDANNATVLTAGQPARIYQTTDGGNTWEKRFEHPNEKSFFDALSFWDRKHGIAMSDPVDGHILLVVTRDGGKTWKELGKTNRPRAMRGEGGFAASGTNMVVFQDSCFIALGSAEEGQQEKTSRVVYSGDRGNTWQEAIAPMPRNSSSGIFSLAFVNNVQGIAVGGNYLKQEIIEGNIAITRDAGRTWHRPEGTPPRGYRSGVTYVAHNKPEQLIAVGPTGTDISTDGGKNWNAASDIGFHSVAFTSDGKAGWGSGSNGRIGKWLGTGK